MAAAYMDLAEAISETTLDDHCRHTTASTSEAKRQWLESLITVTAMSANHEGRGGIWPPPVALYCIYKEEVIRL
jgi:hypothetical protein